MLQRAEHFQILSSMSCDTKPHSMVIRFTRFEGSCFFHLVNVHRTVGTCLSGYTDSRPTYNSDDHIRNLLSFQTSNLV